MSNSQKIGNVMRCPNCGAPYQPGTGSCPECGHVFQNKEQLRSSIAFSNGLQEITKKYSDKNAVTKGVKLLDLREREREEKQDFIKTFFVPTSKEDLMEFMVTMASLRDNCGISDFLYGVYKAKVKECVMKAKAIYGNDPQMMSVVKTVSKGGGVSPMTKIGLILLFIFSIIIGFGLFLASKL